MNTFLKAHLISLKLLIIDIFTLPYKIYSKTLCALAKDNKKKDSDFWVLHWMTKCYDAIIGLSYTVGLILFFLALINVVDSSMYEYSYGEKEVSKEEWMEFDEYKWYVDANGNYVEEYADSYDMEATNATPAAGDYNRDKMNGATFYIDDYGESLNFLSVLLHLVIIYFLPLYIHLIKEIFSIPILQVIRINEIARNTKK